MYTTKPIGVFDSGVGGLTVARAIKNILPNETIYYIGDTANLPYGEKSTEQIQSYVKRIADILVQQGCKVIVIACSTATAAAATMLQEYVGNEIPIINVIDPIVRYVQQNHAGKTLGLIATQYTVEAATYVRKLQEIKADVQLKCLPTPLLVPMIEADRFDMQVLNEYLSNPALKDIEGLILGCTHYWIIKNQIKNYFKGSLEIINGAQLLAEQLQQLLITKNINNPTYNNTKDYFLATRLNGGFKIVTKRLFQQTVYQIKLAET